MTTLNERYLTDADGNRIGVVLDIQTFERLIEKLEDLEDIRDGEAALAALASGEEESIPFDQAIAEIEERRQAQQTS